MIVDQRNVLSVHHYLIFISLIFRKITTPPSDPPILFPRGIKNVNFVHGRLKLYVSSRHLQA